MNRKELRARLADDVEQAEARYAEACREGSQMDPGYTDFLADRITVAKRLNRSTSEGLLVFTRGDIHDLIDDQLATHRYALKLLRGMEPTEETSRLIDREVSEIEAYNNVYGLVSVGDGIMRLEDILYVLEDRRSEVQASIWKLSHTLQNPEGPDVVIDRLVAIVSVYDLIIAFMKEGLKNG